MSILAAKLRGWQGHMTDELKADLTKAALTIERLERMVGELMTKGAAVGSALDDLLKLVGCSSLGPEDVFWTRNPTLAEVQEARRATNELASRLSTAVQTDVLGLFQ